MNIIKHQRGSFPNYPSIHGLGDVDWASIVSLVLQVVGYIIKWCGSNKVASDWGGWDDSIKEKFVADGLKEAYRMAYAGEINKDGRVIDAFAAMIHNVAPGPDWDTFYAANSDWLPNRIADAEKKYGYNFNSKPSEWVKIPIPPTKPPVAPAAPGPLAPLNISTAAFGALGIIGDVLLLGIGVFLFYEAFKE
ncbi:MAG: hypothetical protein NTY96_00305 [Bacteroidetes bacterium]|nr:hypothetical protein [Bacteroidota bacterium]